ncbi:hypothetical protein EYF80_017668 [Liparis tanakae]|uniref:Uncharacterized protein n=1 Tax=Liparis tanakae TaxID=230148 RepID=A0A4Z2I2U3_9TELE|nr:hypothetical protein EYF80_017668 [Liparis tanakae]
MNASSEGDPAPRPLDLPRGSRSRRLIDGNLNPCVLAAHWGHRALVFPPLELPVLPSSLLGPPLTFLYYDSLGTRAPSFLVSDVD